MRNRDGCGGGGCIAVAVGGGGGSDGGGGATHTHHGAQRGGKVCFGGAPQHAGIERPGCCASQTAGRAQWKVASMGSSSRGGGRCQTSRGWETRVGPAISWLRPSWHLPNQFWWRRLQREKEGEKGAKKEKRLWVTRGKKKGMFSSAHLPCQSFAECCVKRRIEVRRDQCRRPKQLRPRRPLHPASMCGG